MVVVQAASAAVSIHASRSGPSSRSAISVISKPWASPLRTTSSANANDLSGPLSPRDLTWRTPASMAGSVRIVCGSGVQMPRRMAGDPGDFSSARGSQPEIKLLDQVVVVELVGGAAFERDLAVDDDVAAVGDADRLVEILLGHQHGERVALFHFADGFDGAADQDRGEADRRLVDQQNLRRQHQRATERQHLLLAARHAAGELAAALGKPRKGLEADVEIALELAPRGAAKGAEQKVLLDGEPRKQPPPLRHQRYAEVDDLFGGAAGEIVMDAVDLGDDRAGAGPHDAHDAFDQGRFAVAVGAEQDHGLAAADGKRHVVDDAHRAVGGMDAGKGQAIGQDTPSPLPDRASPRRAGRRRSCSRTPAPRGAAKSSSRRA